MVVVENFEIGPEVPLGPEVPGTSGYSLLCSP